MGKEVETSEPKSHAPVECPRSGKKTPRDRDDCVFCGQALDLDTETLREQQEEKQQVRWAALKIAGENPELHVEAQEFVKALSNG